MEDEKFTEKFYRNEKLIGGGFGTNQQHVLELLLEKRFLKKFKRFPSEL